MWGTSYTHRNLEFYESLRVKHHLGNSQDVRCHITYPHGVAVNKGFLFVTDWGSHRLVVFRVGKEGEDFRYICHARIQRPVGCAVSKYAVVYVTCYRPDVIREFQFDDRRDELRPLRTLAAEGGLTYPKGMSLDPSGKHVYVACWDAVKKISIYNDSVVRVITKPDFVKDSLAVGVVAINNILMIAYDFPSALVIHLQDDHPGRVLSFPELYSPCGISRHGNCFLVCDIKSKCIHVVNTTGQSIGRLVFTDAEPRHATADDTTIYITDVNRRQIYVLCSPPRNSGLFLPVTETTWSTC